VDGLNVDAVSEACSVEGDADGSTTSLLDDAATVEVVCETWGPGLDDTASPGSAVGGVPVWFWSGPPWMIAAAPATITATIASDARTALRPHRGQPHPRSRSRDGDPPPK
jgi:hypothetical protein